MRKVSRQISSAALGVLFRSRRSSGCHHLCRSHGRQGDDAAFLTALQSTSALSLLLGSDLGVTGLTILGYLMVGSPSSPGAAHFPPPARARCAPFGPHGQRSQAAAPWAASWSPSS